MASLRVPGRVTTYEPVPGLSHSSSASFSVRSMTCAARVAGSSVGGTSGMVRAYAVREPYAPPRAYVPARHKAATAPALSRGG